MTTKMEELTIMKRNELIHIRITEEQKEKFKTLSRKKSTSMTQLILNMIDELIESENKQKQLKIDFN